MTTLQLEQDRLICSPMGHLEYIVESQRDGRAEKWFVLRPHPGLSANYDAKEVPLSQNCRLIVEANSLRPVGVFARGELAPAQSAQLTPIRERPCR
jgi:hypothetical protein